MGYIAVNIQEKNQYKVNENTKGCKVHLDDVNDTFFMISENDETFKFLDKDENIIFQADEEGLDAIRKMIVSILAAKS